MGAGSRAGSSVHNASPTTSTGKNQRDPGGARAEKGTQTWSFAEWPRHSLPKDATSAGPTGPSASISSRSSLICKKSFSGKPLGEG